MNINDLWANSFKYLSDNLPALRTWLPGLTSSNIHTGLDELSVVSKSHICTDNSTSIPLGINGIFVGKWQDTLDYTEVIVSIYANQPSITDGLLIEWSSNGLDIHGDDTFTISASSGKTFSFPCQNRYVRITYKNDGVAQTTFNIETILKRFASKGSSHRLKDNLVQEDDAIVCKTLIAGFSTAGGGSLQNVKVSPSGAVQVGGTLDEVSKSKPFLIDEHGVEAQMLGDNMFAGSPVTIASEHHEIHCGDSFVAVRVATLSGNGNDSILIIVPNETGVKKYHMTVSTDTGGDSTYELFEAPTTTANGTPLTWNNRERNSLLTSGLLAYHTPTVTANGSTMDLDRSGARSSGTSTSRAEEFVLKNNTKYLLKMTNNTATSSFVSWKLNHYIHPGI